MSKLTHNALVEEPVIPYASAEIKAIIDALSMTVAQVIRPLRYADKNRVLLALHMNIADTLTALEDEADV